MGKKRLYSLILIGGVLSAFSGSLMAQDSGLSPDVIVGTEIQRRTALLADFTSQMAHAVEFRKNARFTEAKKIYTDAVPPILIQLGDYAKEQREMLQDGIETLNMVWADYEADLAEDDIGKKDYNGAIAHLHSADEIRPNARFKTRTRWCENILKSKQFTEITDLDQIDPENKDRSYEIATLLGKVKTLYRAKRYDLAKDECEKVFLRDPYNTEAAVLLNKIYTEIGASAKSRRYSDNVERIAEVTWKWQINIPIKDATVDATKNPTSPASGFRSEMYEKLETIIFPSVDYDGVSIRDVIATLIDDSKIYDPRKKGILINHNIPSEVDAEGRRTERFPKITLQLTNVPLGEIIRYVCQASGLKYQVGNNYVFIGEVVEDMERQEFPIETSAVMRIAEKSAESGDPAAAEEGNAWELPAAGTAVGAGGADVGHSKSLKAYFSERGVDFPEGASVFYSGRSGKMYMVNTPSNLRRVTDLLSGMGDLETTMVLIESKFLEVAQHDLEQLGFHWSLTKTLKNPVDPNNPGIGDLTPGAATNQLPQADDILYSSQAMDQTEFDNGAIFAATLIPNAGSNKNLNLNLTITALSQKDLTESLAAPKITATHGKEAVIRMVKQEYYPSSWTQPEIRSTSVGVTLEPAIPEFTGPKDIGITLKVTPQVAPSKNTIELELAPSISEFEAWEEYTYFVTVPGSPIPTEQIIKMPRISYREFTSKIRVYNGETIVLGGVLRDNTNVYDYKYPFLGDIPLVGRLFRDYKNESTRTNLLIFVTARIITGDGMPSKPLENIGIHDFNR